MPQLLDPGLHSILNTNSAIGVGWKLNFYTTGTSTRKNTYPTLADAIALTNANANPVVLSSDGRLPPIWFLDDANYKCVLTDENDVVKETVDPVNEPTLTSLAAALAKITDTVHVFDQGYIPVSKHAGILAGSNTDDVASYIQLALNTGKPVRLPSTGTMWIGSTLLVPSNGGFIGNHGCTIKAKANFGDNPLIRNVTPNPATNGARDSNITLVGVRLDGNKANNATATEFSHGVRLNAVDGAVVDVWSKDTKGDGFYFGYARAEDGSTASYNIGCRGVHGFIRNENAARQGVAITCMEDFDLSVLSYNGDLLGFDVEPDNASSFVRNGHVRLNADQCGQAGSGTRGGLLVHGTNVTTTGKADVRNLVFDVDILSCEGTAGVMWRDVSGVLIRGNITAQTGHGIYGIEAAFAASSVELALKVIAPSGDGLLARNPGDRIDGWVDVEDSGTIGGNIQNANGGTLRFRANSATGAGLALSNTDNMTFPNAQLTGNTSHGLSLDTTSEGNRFPGLKATGNGGWGVIETVGCVNNRITEAILTGNTAGAASISGTTTLLERETLFGKATYDPANLVDAAGATTTVTVTGAALGDEAAATFSLDLQGITLTAWVSAADTVSVRFQNETGGAIDLASGTLRAFVTPRVIA